jgi:hypothetical protein
MAHQSTTWGSLEAGAPPQAPSQKRRTWAIPVAIFALLGAGAFWHFFPAWTGASANAASVRSDFSIELERAGTDYRVTWNGHSPAVMAAKRGVLLIKDGGFEKELELDRDQLATAGVVYAPSTTDVVFRLELFGGPDPAVASVRLLAGSRPQVAAEVPAPETVVPVEQAPPVVLEAPPAETPAESAALPAASEVPATLAAAPKAEDIPAPPAR